MTGEVAHRRNSGSEAHYEALRKAYDERVKSLTVKLRGDRANAQHRTAEPSPATDSTAGLQWYIE